MPIGTTILQHTVYRYSGPVWVDDMDLVWIITVALFGSMTWILFESLQWPRLGHTIQYSLYITVSYSDIIFGYIQFRPMIHFFGICKHDIR